MLGSPDKCGVNTDRKFCVDSASARFVFVLQVVDTDSQFLQLPVFAVWGGFENSVVGVILIIVKASYMIVSQTDWPINIILYSIKIIFKYQ